MFQLRQPVEALQYTEGAGSALGVLAKAARPGASFNNLGKSFSVYNDGPDVEVRPGQWLVKLGRSLAVMDDSEFQALFEQV